MTPDEGARRKLAAILSADVVGYSRLMGQDEQATVETLKACRAAIGQVVERHHGRVVNAPGDALLAEFPSAVEAVQSAVEIQRDLTERNALLPAERQMCYRIGVNLGDVIEEADGTLYGDGVNVAARLEALADAGGVCLSAKVVEEVQGKLDVGFDLVGEQDVKNIAKPVRVYRVRMGGEAVTRATNAPRVRLRRTPGLIAAGALIVLIGAGVAGWQLMRARQPAADPTLALPRGPSIAVLPFANISGDEKQEFLADGITEEIITELTRFRELFVISRNSSFKYKGQVVDVRTIARDLRAAYVLEGSMRRAADTIRVTAQLLDARTGVYLWAESYQRELTATNIFTVQADITERVVGTIAGTHGILAGAGWVRSRRKAPESLDAYECVLRAQEYFRVLMADEHLRTRQCLERAVELDPGYGDAWAWLAYTLIDEHRHGFNSRPNPLDRALAAARRAVDLDQTNQYAHDALAVTHFFRRELELFFPETERTIALNPNNATVIGHLGLLMSYAGEWERGVALVRKAIALNPNYPSWYHFVFGKNHYRKREYHEALAEFLKINMPDYFFNWLVLAYTYGHLGRKEEAGAAIEKLLRLYPGFTVQTFLHEYPKWNFTEDFVELAAEGLRRAGLAEGGAVLKARPTVQ